MNNNLKYQNFITGLLEVLNPRNKSINERLRFLNRYIPLKNSRWKDIIFLNTTYSLPYIIRLDKKSVELTQTNNCLTYIKEIMNEDDGGDLFIRVLQQEKHKILKDTSLDGEYGAFVGDVLKMTLQSLSVYKEVKETELLNLFFQIDDAIANFNKRNLNSNYYRDQFYYDILNRFMINSNTMDHATANLAYRGFHDMIMAVELRGYDFERDLREDIMIKNLKESVKDSFHDTFKLGF